MEWERKKIIGDDDDGDGSSERVSDIRGVLFCFAAEKSGGYSIFIYIVDESYMWIAWSNRLYCELDRGEAIHNTTFISGIVNPQGYMLQSAQSSSLCLRVCCLASSWVHGTG